MCSCISARFACTSPYYLLPCLSVALLGRSFNKGFVTAPPTGKIVSMLPTSPLLVHLANVQKTRSRYTIQYIVFLACCSLSCLVRPQFEDQHHGRACQSDTNLGLASRNTKLTLCHSRLSTRLHLNFRVRLLPTKSAPLPHPFQQR